MAIVVVPADLQIGDPLFCSICCVRLYLDKATAGLFNADNQQVFACVSHFSELELLIRGWAEFVAYERRRYEVNQQQKPDKLLYGGRDAWLNS